MSSIVIDVPLSPPQGDLSGKLSGDFWAIPMDKLWGDLVPASENSGRPTVGWATNSTPESDALDGWHVPSLRLRKDIWENFPVSLIKIQGDTDRYSVVWHMRNLAQWRDERSESNAEFLDYEDYCYYRLMYALALNADRYIVEPAINEEDICIIAMVHSDEDSVSTKQTSEMSVGSNDSAAPLRTLKGIANAFPVCWEQNGNVLAMKFHNKKLRDSGESKSMVRDRLIQALIQSPAGTYTPAPKGAVDVICLFTLNK